MSPHEVIDLMELNAEMLAALRSIADWHDKAGLPRFPNDQMRAAIAKAERVKS